MTLKLKFSDRRTLTRQQTLPRPLRQAAELEQAVAHLLSAELLAPEFRAGRGVRLTGVTVSSLSPADELPAQPWLFGPE